MPISKSVPLANPVYDASGNLLAEAYWHLIQLNACPTAQSFTLVYGAYASAAAFAAMPSQPPLATKTIAFPDPVNQPSATWPFLPASLAANFPNNPLAILLAADAYAMNDPFFSGGSEVS